MRPIAIAFAPISTTPTSSRPLRAPGKTTELVARIINVLASGHAGATIDKIVAVTFTEKAAGELKLRLREELESARQREAGDRRDRLEQALRYLEEARVSTIHGFCADLLRERPVEACVDPQFQVLTDDHASRLYDLAFDAWLQDQLRDPGDGVRRCLRRPARRNFGADIDEDGPVERLRRAGKALLEWRDHPAPWRADPFDREGAIRRLVDQLAAFAAMSSGPAWDKDVLYLDTTRARTGAAAIADGLVPADDLDGLEALLVDLHHDRGFAKPRKGSGAGYSKRHTRAAVWDATAAAVRRAGRVRARRQRRPGGCAAGRLEASLERYDALKAAEGALDFVDLLLRARELLRDDAEVRRTFRQRLSHLFVDEFQDTDPLQAEIVVLLSGDPDADRLESGRLAAGPAPTRRAVHRRRSQAIHLSVSPRRHRHVPRGLRVARTPWSRTRDADDELSGHAGHSASRQRRLCAADDRRRRDAAAAVREADAVAR